MLNSPQLCVVIPVYNEEECIEEVLNSWINTLYFIRVNYRIIIINDGSKDGTHSILNKMAKVNPALEVYHRKNSGHGSLVMFGYHEALKFNPEWVFQVDSDNQFNPKDFHLLWDQKSQYHFLIGNRNQRQDPLVRLCISRFLRYLLRTAFMTPIRDANSPFRLIRADLLSYLLPKIPQTTFAPNIWISLLSVKVKSNTKQVEVQHLPRLTGAPSLPSLRLIRACLLSLYQLLKLRFNSILGTTKFNKFDEVIFQNNSTVKNANCKN